MLGCALPACDRRERDEPHADQNVLATSTEPATVRRGQRTVRVRCERRCGPAQVELSRLQRECVRDPSSTVHHITERAAMIQLGCCTEAASVYTEACERDSAAPEPATAACVTRWTRHCEQGELLELDEPSRSP